MDYLYKTHFAVKNRLAAGTAALIPASAGVSSAALMETAGIMASGSAASMAYGTTNRSLRHQKTTARDLEKEAAVGGIAAGAGYMVSAGVYRHVSDTKETYMERKGSGFGRIID